MPTYVYKCNNHKSPLQAYIQASIHEERAEVKCVDCGQVMVRVFNAPPVAWMGSGWAHKG